MYHICIYSVGNGSLSPRVWNSKATYFLFKSERFAH